MKFDIKYNGTASNGNCNRIVAVVIMVILVTVIAGIIVMIVMIASMQILVTIVIAMVVVIIVYNLQLLLFENEKMIKRKEKNSVVLFELSCFLINLGLFFLRLWTHMILT